MNSLKESVATPEVSSQEVRQIAKEAFIYGFPMVANYQTMHKQAIDTAGHDFRATSIRSTWRTSVRGSMAMTAATSL
jgi:hypothetical protein